MIKSANEVRGIATQNKHIEPCTDDSKIDLEEMADYLEQTILDNDTYNDIYWDAVHTVIEQYLKVKGIN